MRSIQVPEVTLQIEGGQPLPARFLSRVIDNIATAVPVELRLVMPMSVPRAGELPNVVPVRIVVSAEYADEPLVVNTAVRCPTGLTGDASEVWRPVPVVTASRGTSARHGARHGPHPAPAPSAESAD